nr:reverse transcriptase domain-containing protein [Tanacetum cinerariifolium]
MMAKFTSDNTASSSGSGTLLRNTVTNPKEDLKGITTRSGVAYQGPTTPTPSKVVKQGTEVTKDQVQTSSSQSTAPVQPTVTQSEPETPVSKPIVAPVSAPMPNLKPSIPYPLRCDNERRRDQANEQIEKFYEIFKEMSFEISFTDALMLMPKFASTLKALIGNKEKLEYSQEVLGFSDVTVSGSPTPSDDPIVSTTSSTLTPFGDRDFLLFEEADAFLGLEDDPDSPELDPSYYDKEGDILSLESILNSDPSPPLLNHEQFVPSFKEELKACEAKTIKSSIDEPPEENKLIPTRLVTGWRVCIDYRKLHEATRKDHFPLPFMDQMLERLAGNEYYCFLDGFSGYFQILIDPRDQEKTTFACPYGTFAYHRMPFGLCNAPDTFQRFFGDSFENCLSRLDKMLQRCEDTKLCLNWEKSHFLVKEGIVLGHKISKNRIEVDKAKIDVIAKLPHPTTVKGV